MPECIAEHIAIFPITQALKSSSDQLAGTNPTCQYHICRSMNIAHNILDLFTSLLSLVNLLGLIFLSVGVSISRSSRALAITDLGVLAPRYRVWDTSESVGLMP